MWVSLLTLLVKRRIGMCIQRLPSIELSTFIIAKKYTRLVLSINRVNNIRRVVDTKKNWQRAYLKGVKEKGRLNFGLDPIIS